MVHVRTPINVRRLVLLLAWTHRAVDESLQCVLASERVRLVDWLIIGELAGGSSSLTALAKGLRRDPGSLSRAVSRLIERHLVTSVRAKEDRRCTCLALTTEGLNLNRRLVRRMAQLIDAPPNLGGKRERDRVHSALGEVCRYLGEECSLYVGSRTPNHPEVQGLTAACHHSIKLIGTSTDPMMATYRRTSVSERLDFYNAGPYAMKAMIGLETCIARSSLEMPLRELVRLRVSQINGCAYCLDMHASDARRAGEDERRLSTLDAWRETSFFNERERAALAWAEAVTQVAQDHVPDSVWSEAREHFSDAELVDLTLLVVTINGWNRFAISFRKPPAGSVVS